MDGVLIVGNPSRRIYMPYVNLKIVKNQITEEQKRAVVKGITDLIVNIMGRDRSLTIITIDELDASQWAIGGMLLDTLKKNDAVTFVNIKVSKGTTNPDEINKMMKATKELMISELGNNEEANYFIIDEINPEAWGFDGIPMSVRNRT